LAEIIAFPGAEEALRRNLDRMIDEHLEVTDPDLKACIKKRLSTYLSRLPKLPSLNFKVPESLSDAQKQEILSSLADEYNTQVTAYAFKFLSDIALLQLEICQCEHRK
tara:strand:+ start:113 stop:436 length:324 start_codon:yes stop_codon:yes gene_type:complete